MLNDTDEDKMPTGASATGSNDGDSEGENSDPGPLEPQLDEQQNDAAQPDAAQQPDSAGSLASAEVPVLPENTSRINSIRSKQTELAGHYSTLAGALAAALARRANLSVAKIDTASLADPESAIVAEIHESNSGLCMKKEKPLNLFNYQTGQIKSTGAINVGVIWREFYKQKAELKWRMHDEIISKIARLEREKGLLCRMRTNPGPLEVISNNLKVVRNLGPDPCVLPTNEKNIQDDMDLLRRKIAVSKKDISPDDSDYDDVLDQDFPAEKEQNIHALLYEPTQEQNSCLYNLAVAAQPAPDQLIDLLSVGNTELSQPQESARQVPVAPQPPVVVQEYTQKHAQPPRYADSQVQEQRPPPRSAEPLVQKEVAVATEPQVASRPRSTSLTKPSAQGSVHKRTSSQASTKRSSSRHRKASNKHSPPQKRPRVDQSPLAPAQLPLMNNQGAQQMPMNQMHMQPQQVQQMPMPSMQMSMHSPQQVVTAPHQMLAMSPMNPQSQLSNGVQSMPYMQPQMLPPMYQNAQQMPPQMQMAPMQMQMQMPRYGVPGVYEQQQSSMPGVPMNMYPNGMPQMMPVYGDVYFQNPMMQQMAAYPQFDDKGNAVYYPVAQTGPNWQSN